MLMLSSVVNSFVFAGLLTFGIYFKYFRMLCNDEF